MKLTRKSFLKTAGAAAALIIPGCTRIDMIGQFEDNQLAVENTYTDLVTVPGGTFTQTDGTNSFSHAITSFKIGKYEVVYKLWYEVYQWAASNGYNFANAGIEGNDGNPGAVPSDSKLEPVTTVNWRDAIVWCNAYSQKNGLNPVYYADAGFNTIIKDSRDGAYNASIDTAAGSFDTPYVNWAADGYRLPTEGEWQYSASYKDGTSWTPYNYASGANALDADATGKVAWYSANTSTTKAAGTKSSNALGIFDMSGNVWEWCWDWYAAYPGVSSNYRGPSTGTCRVTRGGSYARASAIIAVGYRSAVDPTTYEYPYKEWGTVGFRIAKKS